MRLFAAIALAFSCAFGAAAQTALPMPLINGVRLNGPTSGPGLITSDVSGNLHWSGGSIVANGFQIPSLPSTPLATDALGNLSAIAIGTSPGTLASGSVASGVLNVMDMGFPNVGQGPAIYTAANAVQDTAAVTAAFSRALSAPGKRIDFPCGNYSLTTTTLSGFQIPPTTEVSGRMEACVQIFWNDFTPGVGLFSVNGTAANRPDGIYLNNLTINGTWDTNFFEPKATGQAHQPGAPVFFDYAADVHVSHVTVKSSRGFCFRTQHTIIVQYEYLHAIKCSTDSLSAVWSDDVSITNSTCQHNGDDGISVHSAPQDPYGLRSEIVIANNKLFDCGPIRVLGARHAVIANNQIDFSKNEMIAITTSNYRRTDTEGTEAALDVSVTGNVGSNCTAFLVSNGGSTVNLKTTNPTAYRCKLIDIGADSADPGNLTNFPGLSAAAGTPNAPNGVIDPSPYYLSNPSTATGPTTPVPPSGRLIVSGNVMGRALPPANGTVVGFNVPSDYSPKLAQGFLYPGGWFNTAVDAIDTTPDAVQLKIGTFESIKITGNIFTGVVNCLNIVGGINQIDDFEYTHNQCIDYSGAGVISGSLNPVKAIIRNNIFNGDPYYKSSLRTAAGTWLPTPDQTTQFPIGIAGLTGTGGFDAKDNYFKNVYRISNCDTSANWQSLQGPCNIAWKDNVGEAQPAGIGYNAANGGIGFLDPEGGVIYTVHDYKTTDPNWNVVIKGASLQMTASAMPATGAWVQNRRLVNTAPSVANGFVLKDWLRATTGISNVANVDWIPELEPIYQPASIYTKTGTTSANDNVQICNNPSTSNVVTLTLPNGTAANDNLPIVISQFAGPCAIAITLNGTAQTVNLDAVASSGPTESMTVAWQQKLNSYAQVN